MVVATFRWFSNIQIKFQCVSESIRRPNPIQKWKHCKRSCFLWNLGPIERVVAKLQPNEDCSVATTIYFKNIKIVVFNHIIWKSFHPSIPIISVHGRGEKPKILGNSFRRFDISCLNRRGEANHGRGSEEIEGGRYPLSRRRRPKKIIIDQFVWVDQWRKVEHGG